MVANSTGRFGRRISPGRTPKTARLFQRHVLHRPPIHVRRPGEDMRPGGCSRLGQCRRGHVETPEGAFQHLVDIGRSEEHTSELQSLMRISYAVFCLKKKKKI